MSYNSVQVIIIGLLTGIALACIAVIAFVMRLRSLKERLFKKNDELIREMHVRQCLQKQLGEQSAHVDSVLQNSKQYAIYRAIVDQETGKMKVVFVSPSLCDIFGMPAEELYDFYKWLDYIHKDDIERVQAILQNKQIRPFSVEIEFRIVHPKKGVRWICERVSGLAISEEHEMMGFSNGLITDITEKKLLFEKLKTSEERLKAIFENSLNGILVADDAGNYIDVNPAACKLFGYSHQELLKMNLRDIKRKKQDLTDEQYKQYLKTGFDVGEFDFIDKNGQEKVTDYKAFRIRKDFNVSVLSDITERVYYEKQLQKARKAAEEANKAKSSFLANMSHEIRTPMNGVIGFSQILLSSEPTDKQKEYISYIVSSAKKLLVLINDILDFSKIEAGSMILEKGPVNLRHLIQSMMAIVAPSKKNLTIAVETDIEKDLPEIFVSDELRLSQILTNLMSNALKFTQKGKVVLSLKKLFEDDQSCRIRFCVSDTGIGMEESAIGQITIAFKQADPTITRRFGGTGLGLFITQKLLALMDSSLEIESKPGHGSTFSFDLMMEKYLETDEKPIEKASDQTKDSIETEMTVLIVEDNLINRILAKTLVSKNINNARIFECDTGKKALECYANHHPDLILMDIHMPDMNGIEATRNIRQMEGSIHEAFIIGLTADIKPEKHQEAIKNGMNEVLTKPFDAEAFISILKSHFKQL